MTAPYTYIIRPLLATALILLVPFFLMRFGIGLYDPGSGWETLNWTLFDFVVMGGMLFVAGILLELVLAQAGRYRVVAALAVAFFFLWLWAELAVGVFTTWGS